MNFSEETKKTIDELMEKYTAEPLNDRIVIFKFTEDVKTNSGIILPEKMRDAKGQRLPCEIGIVVGAAEGNQAKVKKGDLVRFDPGFASDFTFRHRELLTVPSLQLFDKHGHYKPGKALCV